MCEQCTTEAVTVISDVLPGFTLMQAKLNGHDWQAGQFGLVECNDPMVVFDGPLLADPTTGLSDEEINALSEQSQADLDRYLTVAEEFDDKLVLDARSGYRLVQACMTKGYCPDTGGNVGFWLMNYLATQVLSGAPAN